MKNITQFYLIYSLKIVVTLKLSLLFTIFEFTEGGRTTFKEVIFLLAYLTVKTHHFSISLTHCNEIWQKPLALIKVPLFIISTRKLSSNSLSPLWAICKGPGLFIPIERIFTKDGIRGWYHP